MTFLVTDIEDSTKYWQAAPEVMQASLARHDAIMRHGIASHDGHVFKTAGDAFYATFASTSRALAAALSLQRSLLAERWPRETPIRVRMALHSGTAQTRDGDYFGPPINVVARILSVARGGQTLISEATRSAFDAVPAGDAQLEGHGYYRLKGVETPVEVFELGVRGLGTFAPPLDTDSVYRVVREGEFWQPVRAIRHNLPAERDAFVGRSAELAALAQRLDAGERLVTVLGPAGTGKTRFACRYGRLWLGDWPGGAYFCDLSEARSLDGVFFTVAMALGVPLGKGDPGVQIGHVIAGRGRCLIILDNFEQITEHAQASVGHWLDRAASASFVVTSRERLHLAGEALFPVEPLPLAKEAVELFEARARAQQPDFALNDANRGAVAEVVRLLDGLPLAIELAAARVRVFSPAQLVERMRDRFRLLAGARGAAARQATLKAAIDWSWDLLAPWEQAALGQCSVFEGGFTVEAAEAVLDLTRWTEAPPAMDAVQALVDKCLLRVWVPAEQDRYDLDEPYFGMYLSIHEYATDKLAASAPDATHKAQERHGQYFARFGSGQALEALSLSGGVKRRHALMLELDNLIAACRRAIALGNGEVAVATFRAAWEVVELQGPFTLAVGLGTSALALDGIAPSSRVAGLVTYGLALARAGHNEDARRRFEQAVALARETGNRHAEGNALGQLGNNYHNLGRMEEAVALYDQALAIDREVGSRRAEGVILGNLGNLLCDLGRASEAQPIYDAALAIHRELGNRRSEGIVLANLGMRSHEQGRIEEARAYYAQALAVHHEVGNRRLAAVVLCNLGQLELDLGQEAPATAHLEAALAILREVGDRRLEANVLANLGALHLQFGRGAQARELQEGALAISREVADPYVEGAVHAGLGNGCKAEGRYDEAREHYEAALALHRATGNRTFEARALGELGDLMAEQRRFAEAREFLRESEALFRELDDRPQLAKLLTMRGRNDVGSGDLEAARRALAEATKISLDIGSGPETLLGGEIARLRNALA